MNSIDSFLEYFGQDLNYVKIGRKYFLTNKNYLEFADLVPEYSGLFLGEQSEKNFKPSLALLELIKTNKKVVIDDKAAWLFVCKKDIFKSSVISGKEQRGIVLVENRQKENLGYGKVVNKGLIFVNNIFDKGDFLRREKF